MAGKPNDKWLATMIKKHGSAEAVTEVQRKIGAKGGSRTGIKGFAANRELARTAGALGGRISRRKSKNANV